MNISQAHHLQLLMHNQYSNLFISIEKTINYTSQRRNIFNNSLLFSSPNRQTDINFLSIVIPHPHFSDSRTICVYIHNSRGNPITTKEDARARFGAFKKKFYVYSTFYTMPPPTINS
jgi:hypothetical protein